MLSSRQSREKIITIFRWNFKIVAFKGSVYAATEMYQLLWFIKFADMWTVPPISGEIYGICFPPNLT